MKRVILLCDGMADRPCEMLGGRTPMEVAYKPHMDKLTGIGEMGTVRTVPPGMAPGSDVANLSVLGYDPALYYTGRSPLEASNLGLEMDDGDVAFRCNLVTLSQGDYPDKIMEDYCAGDIHTEQAAPLIAAIQDALGNERFSFHTGTAYRHCMVSRGYTGTAELTPPHDIIGQSIGRYLPCGTLREMMERSTGILADHPVNRRRAACGLPPANAIWLWGQGRRPRLPQFTEKFGLSGAVISAVDLLKGIGRLTGMRVCEVPGATGYIDTNYAGKADAALTALAEGADFVFIHVEAPDECGHRGEAANKVAAIESIDRLVLGRLLERLPELGPYALMILPDHPTPLALRTHTADPVPYLLVQSGANGHGSASAFTEKNAAAGPYHPQGHLLTARFTALEEPAHV